ncbi:pleckstrin homology domain-containing family O member 1b isoform X1 [Takifugu flavidus]|uniref:pleckstrin homology domain-containing family O member 1b isoform X1 n=1 Tax=Takifugu flavidus TaxID=433684 RepID=UPI002544461D|nr:pleckstrin homology domain-containing family O member 1b isoform X1 [Takifugu flavidus]
MKKNQSGRRGPQDSAPQHIQPDKVGWIRKFCGKGIFREIWKNRFVVLWREQLFICEKEVKEPGRTDEVLDLSDYEHCEEIRKNRSRSKKNHSKFRLQRCNAPGNTVPNLVFLAVSPEEKESWINALNAVIARAKNRILDEVTVDDSQLSHLTRDRVKIPHSRRRPTRGHLLTVASIPSSDGMLTLDLVQDEESCDAFRLSMRRTPPGLSPDGSRLKRDGAASAVTAETSGKSQSLPREAAASWETPSEQHLATAVKSRCASVDLILMHPDTKLQAARSPTATPINRLQELISQKLQATERLLTEVQGEKEAGPTGGAAAEVERLFTEALAAWKQAHEVLEEVKELKELYQQLSPPSDSAKWFAQDQKFCCEPLQAH